MIGNETICLPFYQVVTATPYLIVTLPALFTPAVCIILIVWFIFRFYSKGCYHANAKFHDVCALIYYAEECIAIYYMLIMGVTGMAATQAVIGIERLISTLYVHSYEKFSIFLGLFLSGIAFILSLTVAIYVLSDVELTELHATCMGVPSSAGTKATALYYVIIACDLVTMGLFILSLWLNNRSKKDNGNYILGVKYQKKENTNFVKMLLPNVIAHFFIYVGFSMSAVFIRSHKYLFPPNMLLYNVVAVAINLVPHYTVIELITLHIILSRVISKNQEFILQVSRHKKIDEKDLYFASYLKHWN